VYFLRGKFKELEKNGRRNRTPTMLLMMFPRGPTIHGGLPLPLQNEAAQGFAK